MNNNIDMNLYNEKNERGINKIRNLIDQLAITYENLITAEEYLEYEKEAAHQMMTNEEIIQIINKPEDNLNIDKTIKMSIITHHKASEALEKKNKQANEINNLSYEELKQLKSLQIEQEKIKGQIKENHCQYQEAERNRNAQKAAEILQANEYDFSSEIEQILNVLEGKLNPNDTLPTSNTYFGQNFNSNNQPLLNAPRGFASQPNNLSSTRRP
ncbi:7868_t:CDS:2 [Racocetra fulgida]|uniref:7868_t:CDS:1 n=1 Tax=Racocetra fulgida TaxID=60492 RepID=A0A9N9HJ15_9GLOM|nr:7868_t:CDS:2 [Racocetra fulgida]